MEANQLCGSSQLLCNYFQAKYGPKLLWTAIATYPLMIAIQEMCARIGLVTNQGLMATIKRHYPRPVMYLILLVSFPSIVLNIGADIAGMGAVGNLLFPQVPAFVFSLFFTAVLLYTVIVWNYRKIATVLKWLCISCFHNLTCCTNTIYFTCLIAILVFLELQLLHCYND